eukprot:9228443-Pyramimonas_sp.AAC.1
MGCIGELTEDHKRRLASTSAATYTGPGNVQKQKLLTELEKLDETVDGNPGPSDATEKARQQNKAYRKSATDLIVDRHIDALPVLQVITSTLQKLLARYLDMSGVKWESRQRVRLVRDGAPREFDVARPLAREYPLVNVAVNKLENRFNEESELLLTSQVPWRSLHPKLSTQYFGAL